MNRVTIGATHQRFNSISALLDNVYKQVEIIQLDLNSVEYDKLREDLTRAMDSIGQAASIADGAHHDFQLSLGEGG